jgi:uncharacterized protein YabE (DUF348 family)
VQHWSPRRLKWATGIKIASLAALVAGSGAWVATDRAVTLRVDGVDRTVHTHADDVRGVLASAGVKVGARDALLPNLDAEVRKGDTIELDRARQLKVTIDGHVRKLWVTAPTVDEALDQLAVNAGRVKLSASRSSRLPLDGAALRIATEKRVTLKADGRTTPLNTYATTVGGLLAQQNVKVDADDRVTPAAGTTLDGGIPSVVVQRISTRSATETVAVAAPVTIRKDASLAAGERKVISAGKSGRVRQVVRYVYTDGKMTTRQVLAKTVVALAKPTVVAKGTKAVSSASSGSVPASASGLNWAALAQCESGGRTGAVSPGGTYYGLYQFSVSTWQAMGGSGLPSQASASEQTARAQRLYARSGSGQWPVCGSRLFS